jgi:malate dehydrogenase
MVKSIILDEKRTLPCSAYLDGKFGISGLFVGVPVVLGSDGVHKVVELELTDEEKTLLNKSASSVKTMIEKVLI